MNQMHLPAHQTWIQLHRVATALLALAAAIAITLGVMAVQRLTTDAALDGARASVSSTAEQTTRAYMNASPLVSAAERTVRAYQHSR